MELFQEKFSEDNGGGGGVMHRWKSEGVWERSVGCLRQNEKEKENKVRRGELAGQRGRYFERKGVVGN